MANNGVQSYQALRQAVAAAARMLDQSEAARDHLRQQSNELKALCLVLVRKLKGIAGDGCAKFGGEAVEEAMKAPVRVTKAEWAAATTGPDVEAGKGIALLVSDDEATGDKLIDLGDVEKETPCAPGQS